MSRDPAGFVDGPNLYAYVKQNPWTSFDPHGLAEAKASPKAEPQLIDNAKVYPTLKDARKALCDSAFERTKKTAEQTGGRAPEYGAFIFEANNSEGKRLGYVIGDQHEGPMPKGFRSKEGAGVLVPMTPPSGKFTIDKDRAAELNISNAMGESARTADPKRWRAAEHFHTHPSLSGYDPELKQLNAFLDSRGQSGSLPFTNPHDYNAYEGYWRSAGCPRMSFTVDVINQNSSPMQHRSVTTSLPQHPIGLRGSDPQSYMMRTGVEAPTP